MRVLAELICFQQTIFALPWLLSAAYLSMKCSGGSIDLSRFTIMKLVLTFFFARTAAMTFNGYFDSDFDRLNVRTKDRVLPTYRATPTQVLWLAGLSSLSYFAMAFSLNFRCFVWSIMSIPLLVGYSLFKRFSWTSHLILGLAQCLLPIMVGIALENCVSPHEILLGLALAFNVAAFDIIYSIQDRKFDLECGLYSIPAIFGVQSAFVWSQSLHGLSIATLMYLGIFLDLRWSFFAGCTLLGIVLGIGHSLVKYRKIRGIDFFATGNSSTGIVLLISLMSG